MTGIELEAVVRLAALHQRALERQRRQDIRQHGGAGRKPRRVRTMPLPAVRLGRATLRV